MSDSLIGRSLDTPAHPAGGSLAVRPDAVATGYKNLLVGLTRDPPFPSAALDLAFDLAGRWDAHVTVEVDATTDMPVGMMNFEASAMVMAVNDRLAHQAEAAAERVRFLAGTSGVPCSVRVSKAVYATLVRGFGLQARVHDLAILDRAAEGGVDSYAVEALFGGGRPVMIVPAAIDHYAGARAVVAWDGSAEAARAINAALPLLKSAQAVEVVCVRKAKDLIGQIPGIEMETHLSRHGVKSTLVDLPVQGTGEVQTFLGHIGDVRADLVVMGGYSHPRLREWILGGMTEAMLQACPAVLFMSH